MKTFALCLAVGLAVPASADRVDNIMKGLSGAAPGSILMVAREGKPIRVSTYGLANIETPAPVRRDTVFEIGSVSKQFTAAGVLLLEQEGKLSLDDPIGKHLKDAPEKWRPLTLRQLLSHTSGLKDTLQALDDPKFKARDYWKKMGDLPFDFEPGTSWSYSNQGFNLAADVIEEVSGERMPAFLKKRVFDPLKMDHTRYTDPAEVVPNRAHGYAAVGPGKLRNVTASHPATALGAGTLMSTVDDMVKWNHALLTGRFLSEKSRKEFFTATQIGDTSVPYGMGWFVNQDRGRPIWEHGGNTMGFSCSNMLLPDEKASIIVLTNGANIGVTGITRRIAAELFPKYDLAKRKAEPDPDYRATAQLMMTLRAFGRNQFGKLDVFAPSMRGTLTSVRGAMTKLGLGAMGKEVKTYRHIDSETLSDGRRLGRYAVRVGESATVYVQLTWSRDGKVERLDTLYGQ
jgi:CubicO group peptidase (beta-lactamase class C family)